jgi:hypothetical protein
LCPPRSVIRVDEFDGPKALADYLRRLELDDDLYRSHFDYKLHQVNQSTVYLAYDPGRESDECQLCRKVAAELAIGEADSSARPVLHACPPLQHPNPLEYIKRYEGGPCEARKV